MEQQISISESEWRIMKIVWNDSPRTLPEILDRLKGTDWSKTTIQTYFARLVKKGALSTNVRGKDIYTIRQYRKATASLQKAVVF